MTYFVLLSYDPDTINRFISYIKYYIHITLYINFRITSTNNNYKFAKNSVAILSYLCYDIFKPG